MTDKPPAGARGRTVIVNRDGKSCPLCGARILVVEDETLVALELEDLLTSQGAQVVGPAPSVTRALELLEHEQIDAATLDLNLFGDSALPVAAALKRQSLPFVIVSGYSRALAPQAELQQAPRVDKPVNHRALISILGRLLGQK